MITSHTQTNGQRHVCIEFVVDAVFEFVSVFDFVSVFGFVSVSQIVFAFVFCVHMHARKPIGIPTPK